MPFELEMKEMQGVEWEEVEARMRKRDTEARRNAQAIHDEMVAHVKAEIERTGANLKLHNPGTKLPKTPTSETIAMRFDVTASTALCARQAHCSEGNGEHHRSWPIDLDAGKMNSTVRSGLTRMVEKVAILQGRPLAHAQLRLDIG